MDLSKPEVVRCFFEAGSDAPLPAMELCWDSEEIGISECVWQLPNSIVLKGPAPQRFGIAIHRHDDNAYRVRIVWDEMTFTWDDLTRVQVMTSSLTQILHALGTDLWYLLNQPIEEAALLQAA
jgi:hypothetical protein